MPKPTEKTPQPHTPSGRGRGGKGWSRAKSLLFAQEAGLVLVIVAFGIVLTVFGGTKDSSTLIQLGTGDTYEAEPFTVVETRRDAATGDAQRVDATHYRVRVMRNGEVVRSLVSVKRVRERRTDGGRELVVSIRSNRFLDLQNIVLLANNASYIAVMAVGMTAIIALAGIDLSIGSMYALAALLGAMVMRAMPDDMSVLAAAPLGLLACMGVGAACGLCNGVMIVGLRVHPFIITLGTMAIFRGAVAVITKGQSVTGFPESFQGFFKLDVLGVYPVPTALMIIVALIGVFVLARTVLGRQVYAVGGSELAARYAGIRVGRVKLIVYTVGGLLAGLSACMYIGYYGAADSGAGQAYELRVIAAAVIGGASLSGGRGSALGAALGAVVLEMITNGMLILEIDQDYNQVVMGLAIIAAVVIDQTKTRFMPKG